MSKRSISVKALVDDLNKGFSDAELMHRHELSHNQLQRVFAQLLETGHLSREVLDGRRQAETKSSSLESDGSHVPNGATKSRSSGSPRPMPIEPSSLGLSDCESDSPDEAKTPSLPLSREEASRFRRKGLIFILASLVLVTMRIVTAKALVGAEFSSLALDVVVALRGLAGIGFLVTAILGCLWRVKGLGHHAAWAIVAPLPYVNLVVVEALSNRYEPDADRRLVRVALALLGQLAWATAWSQIVEIL